VSFLSHAGGTLTRTANVAVANCQPGVAISVRRAATTRPAVRVLLRPRGAAGAKVSAVTVSLPKGLKWNAKRAKAVTVLADKKKLSKSAVSFKGSKLTVKLPKGGAQTVDIRAADGAVTIDSKLRSTVKRKGKKAPKLSIPVSIADVAGTKTSVKSTLRPKR
jgi:hypothetical protein